MPAPYGNAIIHIVVRHLQSHHVAAAKQDAVVVKPCASSMFESIVKFVQSTAADAYFSFTPATDRSGPTETDKASPSTVSQTTSAFTLSKKKTGHMSVETKNYTRSVDRFVDEFEAEQKQEEAKVQAQRARETDLLPERQIADSQLRPIRRVFRRQSDRLDERRALGIAEKSPSDAVKIATPMPNPPFAPGRLRPCNTLNEPRSSKGNFYFQRRQKSNHSFSESNITIDQRKTKHPTIRENNHDTPYKRPRTGSSPANGSSKNSAINVDDGQDSVMPDQYLWPHAAHPATDTEKPGTGGLKRIPTDVVDLSLQQAEPDDILMKEHLRASPVRLGRKVSSRSSLSPDELFDNEKMKSARRQRLQDDFVDRKESLLTGVGHRTKQQLDGMLTSSPVPSSKPETSDSRRQSTSTTAQRTPTSRMERRLQHAEESPDALQGECTTRTQTHSRTPTSKSSKQGSRKRMGDAEFKSVTGRKLDSLSIAPNDEGRYIFPIEHYIYHDVPTGDDMVLVVDENTESFSLEFSKPLLGKEPVFRVPVKCILRLWTSPEDDKARIMLLTNHTEATKKLYLEFSNHNCTQRFFDVISTMNPIINRVTPGKKHMDGTFNKAVDYMIEVRQRAAQRQEQQQQQQQQQHQQHQQQNNSLPPTKTNNYFPAGQTGVRKARLVDKLDGQGSKTVISGADRLGLPEERNGVSLTVDTNHTPASTTLATAQPPWSSKRSTRSQASKSGDLCLSELLITTKKASVFTTLPRWKKPLVYPPTGRKRETVQFDDLQRLDEDEFLNDNLVCLFLRYLEVHADPEQMKKIHFFNSFLFEALTKDVKARRDINFDSVKRWTAKVDLFSRDFVIVPVNEHLHWFVMIICNLSYFRRKHGLRLEGEEDDSEILQSLQVAVETAPETILQPDLEEVNEASTRGSFAEMSLDDQEAQVLSQGWNKTLSGSRGRNKPRKSLPKYDVDKPIIITLDSLGQPRSMTASLLRQYIVAEAKDKRGWEIDGSEIKGMTAKGIPHQNNFSDCGLYLCMYLEQFILDPYTFVRRILQRTDEAVWPRRVESSGLRDRLRNLLLKLQKQQQSNDSQTDIPPLGSILVQMGQPEQEGNHEAKDAENRFVKQRSKDKRDMLVRQGMEQVSDDASQSDEHIIIESVDDWKRVVNQPISIDDDPLPQSKPLPNTKRQTKLTSQYFDQLDQRLETNAATPQSGKLQHADPGALAHYLRRQRSPEKQTESTDRRAARSESDSSQYLNSGEDYNITASATTTPQSPPRTSQSPLKTSRKAYQRFKKQAEASNRYTIEIEDNEFEGFPDPVETTVSQQAGLVNSISNDKRDTKRATRKVLRDITASETHEQIDEKQRNIPEMLV